MPNNWKAEWRPGGIFDLMPDAVLVVTKSGAISKVNHQLTAMFGYTQDELLGQPVEILLPDQHRTAHIRERENYEKKPHSRPMGESLDLRGRRKDGTEFPVSVMLGPITGRGDDITMAVVRDLASTETTALLSYTDQLTGLPNRAALFRDHGYRYSAENQQRESNLAIALFDLDGLHDVNISLGFATGDEVLKSVAQRLSMASGNFARLYRLGGDKFVLLSFAESNPLTWIGNIRNTIRQLVEPIDLNGELVTIGLNVGMVIQSEEQSETDKLLADADLALFHAKANGRNADALFSPHMRTGQNAGREFAVEVAEAFRLGQLELYFQPQVRLSDLKIIGAEALLRWNHPVRGVVSPSIFLDALASSPIVDEAAHWILFSACQEASAWQAIGSRKIFVSVNLFQNQITDDALPQKIQQVLAEVKLPPSLLELEISENFTLENSERIVRSLTALRRAGVGLALDDLGTGHASLSQVSKLPVSCLKIDQSFVRQMRPGNRDSVLVDGLVTIAKRLGMDVVAEGIETEAQAKILSTTSCDRGQGYFYGRPMPAGDFREMITRDALPISVVSAA